MNRVETKLQNHSSRLSQDSQGLSIIPSVTGESIGPAHRLIVLVPDDDLDYAVATRRVWELANDMGADILFLGLCKNEVRESSLRRQLIIMTAMIQDGNVAAEAKLEFGNNWIRVVKSHYKAGDVIVCFAEQRAGLLYRPLSQILQSNLKVPLYILSDLYPQSPSKFNMFSIIALWTGLSSILVGSFLLQIRIVSLPRDWVQTILLLLSVAAEFGLIWIWNNLFG